MKVALYARVSSERQAEKELSIPAQLKSLREYATKNGHAIVREFVDEAESGRTSNRPAFREMIGLTRVRQPLFQAILVWKLSRFARNREDSIIYKSALRKKGIQVISVNEPIEDTPSGKLLEGIIEVLDEFYSLNLAQDVSQGMRDIADKGYFTGGCVPLGYTNTKVKDGTATRSTLTPDPATSPIVQRIFQEYLNGSGIKGIVKDLNTDGVRNRKGGNWSTTTVYGILTNEAYVGTLLWGRRSNNGGSSQNGVIRVENAWPAIIDRENFEAAQVALAARSPKVVRPRGLTSDYLLSGLIRCAKCGNAMIGHAAKSGQFFYYRCGSDVRQGKGSCHSRLIPKSKIEGFILDRIKGFILTDDNLMELVRLTNEEIGSLSGERRKHLELLDTQLADVNARLDRLYEALETGKFATDELAPRIRELVSRKNELGARRDEAMQTLEAKRMEIQDVEVIRRYVEDLRSLLGSASIIEQKAFLRSFVKSIEVGHEEATIHYTLPMPPENSTHDKVGVLSLIRNGSAYRIRTGDLLLEREVS